MIGLNLCLNAEAEAIVECGRDDEGRRMNVLKRLFSCGQLIHQNAKLEYTGLYRRRSSSNCKFCKLQHIIYQNVTSKTFSPDVVYMA